MLCQLYPVITRSHLIGWLIIHGDISSVESRGVAPLQQSADNNPSLNGPLKFLAPYRHLQRIEGILHHVVGVEFVASSQDDIRIALRRLREKEKLRSCRSLVAAHEKARRLK